MNLHQHDKAMEALKEQGLSLALLSERAGLHKDKFSYIKHTNKELWEYISKKEESLDKAYTEYINEANEARDKVMAIYFKLQEKRKQAHFVEFCFEGKNKDFIKKDFYTTKNALLTLFQKVFNIPYNRPAYKAYLKHKKIIKLYEMYEIHEKEIA